MKNFCLILSLLSIFISTKSFSQSKERRYYYAFEEKIYLNEVDNKLIASLQKEHAVDIKTLINGAGTEWQSDSICIITTDNSLKEVLKESLLQAEGIKSVQPLYATDDGMEIGITDEFVVKFKTGVTQEQKDALSQKYRAVLKRETELYLLMSVPVSEDALNIANQYQLSGLVEYSHPNFTAKAVKHQTIPSDPYFVNQFYLHNTGQTFNGHSGTAGADINAPEAWDITKGNSSVIIAVVDDGVTSNHPDLPNTRQVRLAGSNFWGSPDDPSPTGDDNHGNACAGVIAASHNNEGIAGIAPNCKIMPVRVAFGNNIPSSIFADAITFAKSNGAYVISNSWGYYTGNPRSVPAIVDAISDATVNGRGGKGCIVVFAVGNSAVHSSGYNGYIAFPSNVNVAGVLAVGASDRYDQQADYSPTSHLTSSFNQVVDIVAPSHRSYSCYIPTETRECWTIDVPGIPGYNPVKEYDCDTLASLPPIGSTLPNSGTNYLAYSGHFGGTSCACPQVSAVAALMLSVNPNLMQQQVADIIESTARKAGGYYYQLQPEISNGTWNPQMGHGVLDAYAAVQAAVSFCVNDFTNQTVTSNITVKGCNDLDVENINVKNNATLKLNAPGTISIAGPFNVREGSSLEVK
jgi:subtilisin family serine protease